MKEIKYVKLDIVGKKLIIPYQISHIYNSIIALEFEMNTPYKFELTDYHIACYKTKSKSYSESVYLTKDMIDKYFINEKEYLKFLFNLKMDKLLE